MSPYFTENALKLQSKHGDVLFLPSNKMIFLLEMASECNSYK